ncbi:MAG: hypothetical protein NVS2B8_02470 [Vulcanimicrobiaceae bacterium]
MEVAVGTEFGLMAGSLSDAHLAESVAPGVTLFAVADGFGEIGRGPTAPLALATVRDYLRRRNRVGSLGRNVSPGSLRSILLAALDHANARLYAQSGSHDDYVGSGTSLTAILLVGTHAFVGHVGDARAYLARVGRLEVLTADDAMFAGTAVTSAKSSLPAKPHARNLLWRSLGTQTKLEASIAHVELLPGDQLALCTDGVHRCISAAELSEALCESSSAADVVARVLAIVKSRGNVDTGTVLVGRDLLAPSAAGYRAALVLARPVRALLAVLVIVAMLLGGAYVVRTGYPDRSASVTSADR